MFCVYVCGEQPSLTPLLKFNIHSSPMADKLRKLGKLKDFTTGKIGKLESKSGLTFVAFQHKDQESAIFLSEEIQDMIDKKAKIADLKKILAPLIEKAKIGEMAESGTLVAYLGGDFTWG